MPITRREWIRRAALLATGAVAADQMDLLDRLGWTRTMFPSAGVPSCVVVDAEIQQMLRVMYADFRTKMFPLVTPVLHDLTRRDGIVWEGPL